MRARILPALLLVCALTPAPARAITAGDARTQSFKLQSEGMRLYKEGKYKEATEAFQRVVNINLNSFMAYYYLGLCLIADRRYGEAIEPLKIALDLQPDYVQAHMALGDACLKQGDAGEARAEYLRVLDLQPNYAAAHDGLGRLFESIGQDDAAEAQYHQALEINVAFADPYTHLGDLYLRRGRLDDAIDLFLKAIAVKPDFASAYTRLGIAYARRHLYDDAIAAARKSQILSPQDPEPYVALARVYLDLESDRRAEAEIQAALALDHDHPGAHLILSDLKRAQEDFGAATEVLQGLYERGIEDAQMRKAVAEALKRVRTDAVGYAALKQAADRTPPDPRDLIALARFLVTQGAHRRAADLLGQAADLLMRTPPIAPGGEAAPAPSPETAAIRLDEGSELIAGRMLARAVALYEEMLGAEPAVPDPLRPVALFNLGVARAALGLDEAAIEAFSSYLAGHPDDARALLYLGNACYRLGRKGEARAAYGAFLEKSGSGAEAAQVRRIMKTLAAPPEAGGKRAGEPSAATGAPAGEGR